MDGQSNRTDKNQSCSLMLLYLLILMFSVQLTVVCQNPSASSVDEEAGPAFDAVVSGIRANLAEGNIAYRDKEGTFDLMEGLELQESQWIRSGSNGRAELLLQPGNYLRIGENTECRLLEREYDRIKLQVDEGTIGLELLKSKGGNYHRFLGPLEQSYELLRIITPTSEILIGEPGIFRIDVASGVTKLTVGDGRAFIDGQVIKEKQIAVASKGKVEINKPEATTDDSFDVWCRERADKLVAANRSLKEEVPWMKKRKEGTEPIVDMPDHMEQSGSQYVVSARPASVNYVESGVEIGRPPGDWKELTRNTSVTAGDQVRTRPLNRVELALLPDIFLRLDGNCAIRFDQLSDENITFTVLQGAAIIDAARFDLKKLPAISFRGPAHSFTIVEDGNYRIDVRSGSEEVTVRKGKVMSAGRAFGSCKRVVNGLETPCGKKANDNFDYWSTYRGEGVVFDGDPMAAYLLRIRKRHLKSTGFWYRHQRLGYYTFVPFSFDGFESPYGGDYSSVLSPRGHSGFLPPWREIP
jgi:hypothetical protein